MDYAKIKSKKLELDIQPNNIREFFTKIYEMHAVKARQKNIKLTMFMDEESLPEKLLFDQSRLTNILVNIASNAIKFTNKGGVQIHAHWFPDSTQHTQDLDCEDSVFDINGAQQTVRTP